MELGDRGVILRALSPSTGADPPLTITYPLTKQYLPIKPTRMQMNHPQMNDLLHTDHYVKPLT